MESSAVRRPRLGRLGKIGLVATVVFLLLFGMGSGAGYLLIKRSLPQTSGTVQLRGLQAPVEILRDRWGVPHIYAESEADLFFAQGWVTAQDRGFQMEIFRRTGRGTLSELFGERTVESDLLMRTLGIIRTAEVEVDLLHQSEREAIEAYTRGVNAYFGSDGHLPLEFTVLGLQPDPWEPVDSLAFAKVVAWMLGGNWRYELLRSALYAEFGEDITRELVASYPTNAPVTISDDRVDTDLAVSLLALDERIRDVGNTDSEGIGSNNWVAAGNRTATGAALLANDPHLSFRNVPAIWYEVHLQAPGLNVAGASIPGLPGVIIGHNDRMAWGMTNLGADVQDLYVEQLNPDNPRQYLFRGRWEDFQVVREEIAVRGQREPRIQEILISRHGPLLNGLAKQTGKPLALRWTGFVPNRMMQSILRLNRAHNWVEFREALRDFATPGQNFVYADVDGHTGYQMTGLVPIRAKSNGLLPVPGWSGEYEWTSFIPYEALPSVFDPPTGVIATANNRVVGDDYPYYISSDWAPDFRIRRIETLLAESDRLTIADFQRIQNDVYSIPGHQIATYLARLQPWDEQSRRAIDVIRNWDSFLTADSTAAAIVEVFYQRLIENVFAPKLGRELWREYEPNTYANTPAVLDILQDANNAWMAETQPSQTSNLDEEAKESLKQALAVLSQRLGGDMAGWRWGRLHTTTFSHPFGQIWPLSHIFNIGPFERPGGIFTINAAGYNPARSSAQVNVPSLRFIADLADFDRSLFVITTGQSGHILSPHYSDQSALWQAGEYHPMPFSRHEVEAASQERLTLLPAANQIPLDKRQTAYYNSCIIQIIRVFVWHPWTSS